MAGRRVRNAAEAERMLAAVASSGMARADWAHEHGVNARSLNMWRLILDRRRRQVPALQLVELVPLDAPAAVDPIVVRCGSFAVEVGQRFDDDVLRRVLAAVAASC